MTQRITLGKGEKFGKLTVLSGDLVCPESGKTLAECLCDCGAISKHRVTFIRNGQAKSCGCVKAQHFKERLTVSVGTKFGRLTVIKTGIKSGEPGSMSVAKCRCECGKHLEVFLFRLLAGDAKSCGCLKTQKENIERIPKEKRHRLKSLDLSREYGNLSPIKYVRGLDKTLLVLCKCKCGEEVAKRPSDLKRGVSWRCSRSCKTSIV